MKKNSLLLIAFTVIVVILTCFICGISFRPETAHAQVNRFDSGSVSVPSSDTLITAVTTNIDVIHCNNTTGGAVTITITDNQSTPVEYLSSVSLPANSVMVARYGSPGLRLRGGVRWQASVGASLNCHIQGLQ